jgi:hypothetical protein
MNLTPQSFFKFYNHLRVIHEGKSVKVNHVHHDGAVVINKGDSMDIARLHQLKVSILSMNSMNAAQIRGLISLLMDIRLSDVGEYRIVSKDKLSITIDYGGVFMSIDRGNISVTDHVNGAREAKNVGLVIMYLMENRFPVFDTSAASFRDILEHTVSY